jgi:aryl-alcohol dehydrogenase-like predicted oxidoreductase
MAPGPTAVANKLCQIEPTGQVAELAGVHGPVAAQPPYSLIRREAVDNPVMQKLAAERSLAVIASFTLAGGVLTGK